jgi:hypothetical protein
VTTEVESLSRPTGQQTPVPTQEKKKTKIISTLFGRRGQSTATTEHFPKRLIQSDRLVDQGDEFDLDRFLRYWTSGLLCAANNGKEQRTPQSRRCKPRSKRQVAAISSSLWTLGPSRQSSASFRPTRVQQLVCSNPKSPPTSAGHFPTRNHPRRPTRPPTSVFRRVDCFSSSTTALPHYRITVQHASGTLPWPS